MSGKRERYVAPNLRKSPNFFLADKERGGRGGGGRLPQQGQKGKGGVVNWLNDMNLWGEKRERLSCGGKGRKGNRSCVSCCPKKRREHFSIGEGKPGLVRAKRKRERGTVYISETYASWEKKGEEWVALIILDSGRVGMKKNCIEVEKGEGGVHILKY